LLTPSTITESSSLATQTPALRRVRGRSLRANVTWTLASNLVSAGSQWGMVVAIAKLGNPIMVGQYALALAIVAPLILFSNLQLRAIQVTDIRGEFQFGDYLGVRLTATVITAIAILLLVMAGSYQSATAFTILGLTFSKGMEGVSDIFYGFLQQRERMDRIAQSTMIRMPLSLAAMTAAVYWTHSVFIGTLGLAVVQIAVLLSYDVPVSARLGKDMQESRTADASPKFWPKWRFQIMKNLAWMAAPLGGAMLLISLQTNIPRYFIERFLGERELGIFAALAYFLAAGNIVTEAIGQSVMPRLARMFQGQDRRGLRKLLLQLVALGALGGFLAWAGGRLVGPQVLKLLYRPEYAKHMNVFLILLLSAAPTYMASFLGYAMTAARLFWLQVPLSLIATTTVALACLWLVPTRGLIGAAEALLALSVVRLIVTLLVVAKEVGLLIQAKTRI
jgi:O-antigen/teichoic acid export membrane protein